MVDKGVPGGYLCSSAPTVFDGVLIQTHVVSVSLLHLHVKHDHLTSIGLDLSCVLFNMLNASLNGWNFDV